MRFLMIAVACAVLAGCETNPNMTQAERDYRYQRSMQILQQWQATQPQAPAIQPNVRMNCRHYYVGTTLRTECM